MECLECHLDNPSDSKFCKECGTQLGPASVTKTFQTPIISSDRTIAGKYEILGELGRGGMGVVYKAKDTKLMRTVALKFLPPELTSDQKYKDRFILEAQAASALDHPNICTIHEINETDDEEIFIAMPCYEGETLKIRIQGKPLPIDLAIDIAIQVAQGLKKAHSKGIVHRDIKSANIMITSDGVVKILDFGLASLTGDSVKTRTAAIMGTAAYMSPEQAEGEAVDNRTDFWSLGVVLYEMLTGQMPFEGENSLAIIHSILNKSPIPPTELRKEIPTAFERIILKCLRREQGSRYQSVKSILSDLTKLQSVIEREELGVSDDQIRKPETKKEAERRRATVLFVEIIGYSEMIEREDAEDVASIMTRCFKMLSFIEEKYGGRINKITESSFRILFGIPEAVEDASKKAVNAAIELRNQIKSFRQRENLLIPFDVKVGIETGMVIVGAMEILAREDYVVMGETVDRASQLKDLSTVGQIMVGPSTYKYTKEDFEYRPPMSMILRGKKGQISVYELLSVKPKIHRLGLGSDRMVFSDMVGRDSELDKLQLHMWKVINGEGSVVNVVGEAGIGKSRLIAELQKKDDVKKVCLLKGRALSIGKNLSFHPLIDIIKNWARIEENDSGAESFRKFENACMSTYPEGAAEIVPFVATLMGMKLSGDYNKRIQGIEGEALEKLILKNLRDLFVKIAEKKPLIIVIEDLHWADSTSIEFFESLYRLAENNRILFINVFRPDYVNTSERVSRTIENRYKHFSSEIFLVSLDEKHSEDLIYNLLKIKGLSPNIREIIVKRAGGNPFFLEEIVRSFIDDGVIELEEGKFRVTEKIDSVVIPETINEVIMARIDKFEEETKSLLKVASVIGRNFFYKILADVAEETDEIEERLEFLKERQLILERHRMAELEYLFKHALAQEATYSSILVKKRKELHLKIANSIASIFSERIHEFYGMLAFHYSKGEDLDKAEDFLVKAGGEALKSSASSEALHFYREALTIYLRKYGANAEPGRIAMLEKYIALALFNKGQYVEADEYFSKVLRYYGERLPRHRLPVIVKFSLGFLTFLFCLYFPFLKRKKTPTQRDNEIINLYLKKNTALIVLDPRRMFVEIFYWLWRLMNFDLTKVENGVDIISMSGASFSYGGISFRISRKVLQFIKDKIDKNDVKSMLYFKLPNTLLNTFSGNWDLIEEYDENLVDQNIRIGELFYATSYVLIHGYSKITRGHLNSSLDLAQRLYEISDAYENDNARSAYFWYKTQVLVKFRKIQEALKVSEEGINFTNRTGFKPYMFSLYSFKARIQIMLSDTKAAEKSLRYLRQIKPEINLVPYFSTTFYLSQLILDLCLLEEFAKGDDKTKSLMHKKRALKTAKKAIKYSRKSAADLTESYKLMGVYFWLLGRQKKAMKWWKKSISEGERLEARLELSRTFFEVGKRLSEKKSRYKELNEISSQEYLTKAKSLFEEMDLKWDLEQLEKIECHALQRL